MNQCRDSDVSLKDLRVAVSIFLNVWSLNSWELFDCFPLVELCGVFSEVDCCLTGVLRYCLVVGSFILAG